MPKRPSSGRGGLADGPRSGCGAQGTRPSRFFFCDGRAQTPGRRFFGYFLVAVDKKVTRLKAETHGFIKGRQVPDLPHSEARHGTRSFAALRMTVETLVHPLDTTLRVT